MPFGVPQHWKKKRHEDQGDFYCPNGHIQYYSKSTEQRLREEISALKRRVDLARDSEQYYRGRAEKEKRRAAAHAGVATKRKKKLDRVAAGVCPCCNRTFQNLAQHMKTKHPDHSP